MKNQWLIIKQLDKQLKEWQSLAKKYPRPSQGWIKTLRLTMSMSIEQFADRLGLSRGRINQLENAEIHNAVSLKTLNEAANALGCELIYAIVPQDNSSLEDIIKKRAEVIADERVTNVAHSMLLEAQSVDAEILKFQKEELAKSLIDNLNKNFWAPIKEEQLQGKKRIKKYHVTKGENIYISPRINIKKRDKQNALLQKLIQNLQKKK